jgi:hypothetical protein
VGSRSKIKKEELAYLAGFLDGDGSLMLQIKKRSDSKRGWRLMATICFYQDSRHDTSLYWMRKKLKIGYISHRNDGMTELRINGFDQVKNVVGLLIPYLRFKKKQARVIIKACVLLARKPLKLLSKKELNMICNYLVIIQKNNYTTHSKKSLEELKLILGLTP